MIDPAEGTANGTSAIGSGRLGARFRHCTPPVFTLCINELPSSAANDAAKPTKGRWRRTFQATGPAKGNRQGHPVADSGRKGRLIRHTFLRDRAAPAQRPLTVSMIESSLGTLLVTPVCAASYYLRRFRRCVFRLGVR